MSELVTDEIVEATAQAFYEAEEREVGTLEVHPWDGVIGERREAWKICARAALDVAAPLIAGRALREAADDWQTGEWANVPRRADRVADRLGAAQHVCDWLRAEAGRAEKGAGR